MTMEGMSYQEVLEMSRTWSAVYFFALFAVACIYAFWPRNRAKFERAAQIPLENEEAE
jgi:cytochrome c oxidase cbb3-type subunit IV